MSGYYRMHDHVAQMFTSIHQPRPALTQQYPRKAWETT